MTNEKGIGNFLTTLKAFKTQKELHHCLTTLNPIQDGGEQKGPFFFPVTFTNVGISPLNFLTFSFNPFVTLVRIKCQSQIIELEPRPPIKNADFLVKSL